MSRIPANSFNPAYSGNTAIPRPDISRSENTSHPAPAIGNAPTQINSQHRARQAAPVSRHVYSADDPSIVPLGTGDPDRLFKKMAPDGVTVECVLKIMPRDELCRNLATGAVATLLGWPVVAPQHAAIYGDQQALKMPFVTGVFARSQWADQLATGTVRRDLTRLQILDLLTVQTDRNITNVLIDTGRVANPVCAIDHEYSFLASAMEETRERIPTVIDSDMQAKLSTLSPQGLISSLRPYLGREEISMTLAQLSFLQNHFSGNHQTRIIDPQEWQNIHPTQFQGSYAGFDFFDN
ncbi:MAG: hypothetical protein ACRYGK_08705 [Janthinobacterium lividum]